MLRDPLVVTVALMDMSHTDSGTDLVMLVDPNLEESETCCGMVSAAFDAHGDLCYLTQVSKIRQPVVFPVINIILL